MNFSLLTCNPLASRHAEIHDDEGNDWLGGEAWVTPQSFAIERFGVADVPRKEDPANDWIPL